MTQMLASVVNLEEALIALEAGTDIIDLKNPAQGALGALPLTVIRDIVMALAGAVPVSATIGDLPMQPDILEKAVKQVAATGVDIVKIGFFGNENFSECLKVLSPLAVEGVSMVAVLMADQQPDLKALADFKRAGFYGVMLDTAQKNGKHLLDFILLAEARFFVENAYKLGMKTGLAGSLGLTEIPQLLDLMPTYLGFRGAICQNKQRVEQIDRARILEIKQLLRKSNKMAKCLEFV